MKNASYCESIHSCLFIYPSYVPLIDGVSPEQFYKFILYENLYPSVIRLLYRFDFLVAQLVVCTQTTKTSDSA